jgi:hypothetical protein
VAVAAQVAQGHPASRRRRRTVRCPECDTAREVSYENFCRIQRGEQTGRCRECPTPLAPRVRVTDKDRKFWLVAFGVPASALRGTTASEYIGAHGIPLELAALAASIA